MDKHSLRLSKEINNSITNNHDYLNFVKKNHKMLDFQRNKLVYPIPIDISRNSSVFAFKEAKKQLRNDKLATSANTPVYYIQLKNNQKQQEIITSQKVYQIVQRKHKEIQDSMNKEKQSMSEIIYNYSKFRSMESQYYKKEKVKKKSERIVKKEQKVKLPQVSKPNNEVFTIDYDPLGQKVLKINLQNEVSQMKKKSHSLLNEQAPNKEYRNNSQQKALAKKRQQALFKRKKLQSQFGIEIKSINSKLLQNIAEFENGLKLRKELYQLVNDSPVKTKERISQSKKQGDQLLQKELQRYQSQQIVQKKTSCPKFKHKYSSSSLSYRQQEDLQFYAQSDILNKKEQTQKQKPPQYQTKKQNFKKNLIVMYDKQITVYDQKISSYREFLFMLTLAHNKYDNLILKDFSSFKNEDKYKFYVGNGNNSMLIKSLMKRRFWWTLEQDSKKANFAWTQLKINNFYQYQRKSELRDVDSKIETNNDVSKKKKPTKKQVQVKPSSKTNIFKAPLPVDKDKIFTSADKKIYQQLQQISLNQSYDKISKFAHRLRISQIGIYTPVSESKCNEKMHNHLQFNHFIGNKKALFYNLKKYYDLQNKNVFEIIPLTFHLKNGLKDPQYTNFCKQFKRLQNMKFAVRKKKDKQSQQNKKTKNVWIVKPGQLSNRGNGIVVINQIYELNNIMKKRQKHSDGAQKTYIVQKYIQNPLLYKGRKFDIRHYMIITRLHGIMRAYWYGEGYIRTSSFNFDLDDVGDQMIHLTNDAIQKNSTFYGKHEQGNKLSYTQFQKYLDQRYEQQKISFAQHIYPKMKAISTDAVKATYLQLDTNHLQHNFEVFGLDFMIDQKFNVWLIEVNTNPCLEISSKLLGRIIPNMLQQAFRLSVDVIFPPPTHYPNSQKYFTPDNPLGRLMYELIFDEARDGQGLIQLYKDSAVIDYGQIMQDEQVYQNQGKQIQLSPDIS